MDSPKHTPLHHIHVTLGAKLVPFGGYEMPVSYPAGIAAEHRAVREHVGVFDVSRSEEHTSELQSRLHLVCRLLLEKKNAARRPRSGCNSCGVGLWAVPLSRPRSRHSRPG